MLYRNGYIIYGNGPYRVQLYSIIVPNAENVENSL